MSRWPARRGRPGGEPRLDASAPVGSGRGPGPAPGSVLPEAWSERVYLALDFETTGLDARSCRVVEVGALRFRIDAGGGIVELGALASLVHPRLPIPPFVTGIHGITDAMVALSPGFEELCPAILALAEGAILVAHNAPFDLSFLLAETERAGLPAPSPEWLCTRNLSRAAFPGLPGYRLGELAARLGVATGESHRALDDARACMGLFAAAAPRLAASRGA